MNRLCGTGRTKQWINIWSVFSFTARECSGGAGICSFCCQADGFRRCHDPIFFPLHPPFVGQPWVQRTWSGAGWASGFNLWSLERGCSGICVAERCLPILRWERRGNVPQYLPSGLQLPWRLFWRCEQSSAWFCAFAITLRSSQATLSSGLPAGWAMAPSTSCLEFGPSWHSTTRGLHWKAQAPEWLEANG